MKKLFLLALILSFTVLSCEEQPVETVFYDFGGNKGVFISNEGNFMYSNATLSFYDKFNKKVYNHVFFARNNVPLGDVAQSLASDGKTLFIVVNNSGRIYGVDPVTASFKGVITGLSSPRNIHFVKPGKAYVSDLMAQKIWIMDPVEFSIIGSIDIADGSAVPGRHAAENFLQVGPLVYVSCWSYDNYLLIIDPDTDQVVDSVSVPLQPKEMVSDKHGKVWVLSDGSYEGSPVGHDNPALTRINPVTRQIEQVYRFESTGGIPARLVINPALDTLLFLKNGIFKMAVSSSGLPSSVFIPAGKRLFASLAIDPENGEIYAADFIDYAQNAMVYRFSPAGAAIDSFRVGINPGGFWFN